MSHDPATPSRRDERLARLALVAHTVMIVFGTGAFVSFLLAPTLPAWLQTEPNATVYRLGWQLAGPLNVLFGALAALAHLAARFGWGRALAVALVASTLALGAELLGTTTGLPFGPYEYTTLLGWRVLDLVPFAIPVSWFYMLYCSLAIAGRLLAARDDLPTRFRWALAAGAILTAWDVSMDPAMSYVTKHWFWKVDGFFYTMPLLNWFGWYLTGTVVAFAMLLLVRPSRIAARVSPSRFPLALYAVNGVMPVAMLARAGLWDATAYGALAMAIPLALAVRAGARRRAWAGPRPAMAGGD